MVLGQLISGMAGWIRLDVNLRLIMDSERGRSGIIDNLTLS